MHSLDFSRCPLCAHNCLGLSGIGASEGVRHHLGVGLRLEMRPSERRALANKLMSDGMGAGSNGMCPGCDIVQCAEPSRKLRVSQIRPS